MPVEIVERFVACDIAFEFDAAAETIDVLEKADGDGLGDFTSYVGLVPKAELSAFAEWVTKLAKRTEVQS